MPLSDLPHAPPGLPEKPPALNKEGDFCGDRDTASRESRCWTRTSRSRSRSRARTPEDSLRCYRSRSRSGSRSRRNGSRPYSVGDTPASRGCHNSDYYRPNYDADRHQSRQTSDAPHHAARFLPRESKHGDYYRPSAVSETNTNPVRQESPNKLVPSPTTSTTLEEKSEPDLSESWAEIAARKRKELTLAMTITGSAGSLPPLETPKAKPGTLSRVSTNIASLPPPKIDAKISLSKRSAIRQEQGRRIQHQVSSWITASMVPRRKNSLSGAGRMAEKEVKAGGGGKNSACSSSEPTARTFQLDINDVQVEQSDLFPKPSARGCLPLDHSDRQTLLANSSPGKDSPVHLPAQAQPHLLSASRSKKVIIDSAVLRDRIEKLRQAATEKPKAIPNVMDVSYELNRGATGR